MKRAFLMRTVVLLVAATALDIESGRAATQDESENPIFAAEDTILLEQSDGHLVANLKDLLEWRGALVVVDALELNLKTYDLDTGERLAVWGRRGQGPGEFMSLTGAVVMHDGGLAVLDMLLNRVTIFDAPGEVRTSWRVPAGGYCSAERAVRKARAAANATGCLWGFSRWRDTSPPPTFCSRSTSLDAGRRHR